MTIAAHYRLVLPWMAAAVWVAGPGALVAADNPGDEVVLVYNKKVPESKGVADYYAERRRVPTNQIFGFELSTNEDISRVEFRNQLQRPLSKALEDAKLWRITSRVLPAVSNSPSRAVWRASESKVRYLVLCYGVPLRIEKMAQLKEPATEGQPAELRRDEAAVDSELALLPVLEQDLPLGGPVRNPVYGATNEAAFHPTNGVLLVSRLDGPTSGIARGLVDKAIQAENEGLWGRTYFDLRNTSDPVLKPGDSWIRSASELCRHLGFASVVDENVATFPASFPMSHIAFYLGWYDEHVSGPFTLPNVEFMTGAFAYHLHSFSAASLRSTTRNWAGPLLAKGVTATMGSVHEPYLSGTPDLVVFMSRFVYFQFDFGASACAAQPVLSWQTTVVGDPLFRPFGRTPEDVHEELERTRNPALPWSYLRLVNLNLANAKPIDESVTFLEQLGLTRKSAILSEKLADLYAQQGKPSSAVQTYELALKLDPSPQQKIRLILVLGEKLSSLDRSAEAYENYQQLIRQFPNYPDKVNIYKRLLTLAQALNKKEDIEKIKAQIP